MHHVARPVLRGLKVRHPPGKELQKKPKLLDFQLFSCRLLQESM